MKSYFKKSGTIKIEHDLPNYSELKIPDLGFGFSCKSVQQMKADLAKKIEYKKALKRLDITPNPSKYRNPFKCTPEPLLRTSIKKAKLIIDDGLDEFIDAMFFNVKNSYKLLSKDPIAPIDYYTAELQVRNLKRLKPIIKGILEHEVDRSPLEEFWTANISKTQITRWDIFEENLCRHFILNINTSIGKVRKINWDVLLKKLMKEIAINNSEIDLLPGHPGLSPVKYSGLTVSLQRFQDCVSLGSFKRLVSKSLRSETYYITEKYKVVPYKFVCGCEYKGIWRSYTRDGLSKMKVNENFVYEGYFFRGLRHGHGSCDAQGSSFHGYWEDDLFDGPGEITYFDGSSISGIWKKGKIISGKLKWAGGEYTGYLNSLHFQGLGTLVSCNDDMKKGVWHESKLNGEGEVIKRNGCSYKGTFVEDLLEGAGFIETPTFVYKGDVKHSVPDGEGMISYKSTVSCGFQGGFKAGIINGKGVLNIGTNIYQGEFVYGKLSGKGERIIGQIGSYKGEFSDSLMHGKGKLKLSSEKYNILYIGEFKSNRFNGPGKLRFNKNEYKGEFSMGLMSEAGEISLENLVYKGQFVHGAANGSGTIHFIDGSSFKGEWSDNMPLGNGEAIDSSGYWLAANFIEGKPLIRHRLKKDYFKNLEDFIVKIQEFCKGIEWIEETIRCPYADININLIEVYD